MLLAACNWLFAAASFAQAPAIQWQNTIGGSNGDGLLSIRQTAEGGYILGGYSNSNISGDKTENCIGLSDYWIVKIDVSGNIQWQNTIGGSGQEELYSISQTSDGGYICGGWSDSNISGDKTENSVGFFDYWIVKTDAAGNIQWQNTIGGSSNDYLQSVQQTSDGGYILGGWSNSNISGDKTENSAGFFDYWIVKLDSIGSIQWQNTVGGSNLDYLFSVSTTADSGYICGGTSYSDISADKTENSNGGEDYWVIKLDYLGNIEWQNTIGGSDDDELYSIVQTADKGFICGGFSYSNISGDKTENSQGDSDYWIIKLDSTGSIQWQNTLGGISSDNLFFILQANDGGYFCAGTSESNISGDKTEICQGWEDYWVIKLDTSGNMEWQNTIGGNSLDHLASASACFDGGYICGGFSFSNISGDKTENNWDPTLNSADYWLIKLFPDTITGINNLQPLTPNFKLFPNPAQEEFTVSGLQFPVQKIEILNLLGETVLTHQSEIRNSKSEINTSSLSPGIYIIKVYADEGVFQQKLVINH